MPLLAPVKGWMSTAQCFVMSPSLLAIGVQELDAASSGRVATAGLILEASGAADDEMFADGNLPDVIWMVEWQQEVTQAFGGRQETWSLRPSVP